MLVNFITRKDFELGAIARARSHRGPKLVNDNLGINLSRPRLFKAYPVHCLFYLLNRNTHGIHKFSEPTHSSGMPSLLEETALWVIERSRIFVLKPERIF